MEMEIRIVIHKRIELKLSIVDKSFIKYTSTGCSIQLKWFQLYNCKVQLIEQQFSWISFTSDFLWEKRHTIDSTNQTNHFSIYSVWSVLRNKSMHFLHKYQKFMTLSFDLHFVSRKYSSTTSFKHYWNEVEASQNRIG